MEEEPAAEDTGVNEGETVPEESKPDDGEQKAEHVEGDHVEGEHVEGEHAEGEHAEGEHVAGEHVEGEHAEGEHVAGEHVEGEHAEGEHVEGERVEGEHMEGEMEGEHVEGEGVEEEEKKEPEPVAELPVEEEEVYVEEPPPDPAAPYNLSDSQEMLKPYFELRPDQLAEVEQIWEEFQNYTPAYSDIKDYITEKELIYMLKSLLLMTYTPEQFQELIDYCVRPPHPEGHITYPQFLKMVTLRQREFPVEDELRAGLQVLDPEKTNLMNRDYFREVLSTLGNKLPPKQLEYLIKEVDIAGDGTIGIEDVVGTMCVDLNTEDIIMLRNQLFPPDKPPPADDDDM